ncbi:lysophosphatidylserine lipase ABHD12 [Papilio machaon]|uniref:lysophosphatidylserine lipase ABHD12 n=1 Tax=Papilio machaon TaxID=76193 RepID=UPI001E662E5C|nr:lysophosphatidylserine lipase ABHD12 [Papilio machaon]
MVLGGILMAGASLTASVLLIQVAVLPLVFRYSKCVQRKMVFTNCINYPRNLDYNNPSSCNIIGARNFTVEFQSKINNCKICLGVWHIVPCSLFKEIFVVRKHLDSNARLMNELRQTQNTVVLYCHGNCNHRASPHRLNLYKVFQELNFHVITFDYRGYGDSTNVQPTERGVVEDTLHVYSWILRSISRTHRPMVVIWGHSLGTAVAAHLVAHLSQLCGNMGHGTMPQPSALILEAPFNNLIEEIESHPFSKLVSWLPYYKATFLKPFAVSSEYAFTTDQYLMLAPQVPILILHSRSDRIVPYELAVKLYTSTVASRREAKSQAPVVLHGFERGQGLGHNNLCQAPDLPDVVRYTTTMLTNNCHTSSLVRGLGKTNVGIN